MSIYRTFKKYTITG